MALDPTYFKLQVNPPPSDTFSLGYIDTDKWKDSDYFTGDASNGMGVDVYNNKLRFRAMGLHSGSPYFRSNWKVGGNFDIQFTLTYDAVGLLVYTFDVSLPTGAGFATYPYENLILGDQLNYVSAVSVSYSDAYHISRVFHDRVAYVTSNGGWSGSAIVGANSSTNKTDRQFKVTRVGTVLTWYKKDPLDSDWLQEYQNVTNTTADCYLAFHYGNNQSSGTMTVSVDNLLVSAANLKWDTGMYQDFTGYQFESPPIDYIAMGGSNVVQFESLSLDYIAIGGEPASIFYESEALEISSQLVYAFAKDKNNKVSEPYTTIALQVTGI